jgi:virulence-associated protein VagC
MSTGCGKEFDPVTLLNSPRVLAMVMEPVEVSLGQSVEVQRTLFVPEGATIVSEDWTFCPITLGPYTSYECLVPECEVSLEPTADGDRVIVDPLSLSLDCFKVLSEQEPDNGSGTKESESIDSDNKPEFIEMIFRYHVELDTGAERTSIARVKVYTEELPELVNTNPIIEDVQLPDGTSQPIEGVEILSPVERETEIRVKIAPDSVDDFVNNSDETVPEEPFISFFSTAGTFDSERLVGTDVVATWSLDASEDADSAEIWIVARDGRGGQAVAGPYRITVAP